MSNFLRKSNYFSKNSHRFLPLNYVLLEFASALHDILDVNFFATSMLAVSNFA